MKVMLSPATPENYNAILGAPVDWDVSKMGECLKLPVIREEIDGVLHFTSFWKLSPEALDVLKNGGAVQLTCLTGQPPVSLSVIDVTDGATVAPVPVEPPEPDVGSELF